MLCLPAWGMPSSLFEEVPSLPLGGRGECFLFALLLNSRHPGLLLLSRQIAHDSHMSVFLTYAELLESCIHSTVHGTQEAANLFNGDKEMIPPSESFLSAPFLCPKNMLRSSLDSVTVPFKLSFYSLIFVQFFEDVSICPAYIFLPLVLSLCLAT